MWTDHYKPQSKCHGTEGKHPTLPVKRSSICSHQQKKMMLTLIGLKSTNPGTLFTEGHNSQQCLLQRDALALVKISQSNGIPRNGEGCCIVA
jgi:hypothetical protein